MYENKVTLQGVIKHMYVTPNAVVVTIGTGNATKKPNSPRVLFFGPQKEAFVKAYKVGERVKIEGNVQSSIRNEKNKHRDLLTVFGESYDSAESAMEKAFDVKDDNGYKPYLNSMKLAGDVVSVRKLTDNLVNMTIFTKTNGHISFVTVSHYTENADEFAKQFQKQDSVYVIGNIQTVRKEIKGEQRYFQNYVATEIVKQ